MSQHTTVIKGNPGPEEATEPTTEDPDTLHQVAELRAALRRANTRLCEQQAELRACKSVVRVMGRDVAELLLAWVREDVDALGQKLNTLCRQNLHLVTADAPLPPGEGGQVH